MKTGGHWAGDSPDQVIETRLPTYEERRNNALDNIRAVADNLRPGETMQVVAHDSNEAPLHRIFTITLPDRT